MPKSVKGIKFAVSVSFVPLNKGKYVIYLRLERVKIIVRKLLNITFIANRFLKKCGVIQNIPFQVYLPWNDSSPRPRLVTKPPRSTSPHLAGSPSRCGGSANI